MRRSTIILVLSLVLTGCGMQQVEDATMVDAQPAIWPDYAGVTVPVNIAPLNFSVADSDALLLDVVMQGPDGSLLHAQGRDNSDIDAGQWQQLLSASVGDSIRVTVSVKGRDGWRTYRPFAIGVSPDSIDYGICYRLIEPGYEVWSRMGIYEYCLQTARQTPLIENTQFDGCVNCHSFNRGKPTDMSLHIRGKHGATLLRLDGRMQAYNTKTPRSLGFCVYPYWHPEGRYIAYSTNTTRQVFHITDANRIEVFDAASDVQVYDTRTGQLLTPDVLRTDSLMETFPAFSADGRTLFFCASSGKADNPQHLDSIRYNLYCVDFDAATGTFGDSIRLLLDAASMGKSISFPRPSYDGRHLVYTLSDYGQFSIWHHEADLWLTSVDSLLACGSFGQPMAEANSADTESYHSWSSNSRWMLFSSRRDDGLFTRPYFTHVDAQGRCTKPFLLPQSAPRSFYRDLFMSYNVPEFVTGPVCFDARRATSLINDERRVDFQ